MYFKEFFKKVPPLQAAAIAIVYLLTLVTLFLFLLPHNHELKQVAATIENEMRVQDGLLQVLGRRSQIESSIEQTESGLGQFENSIPTKADLPLVLEFLENQGKAFGLNVRNWTYIPPAASQADNTVFISGSVSGAYDAFADFIRVVNQNLPTSRLRRVVVNTDAKGNLQVDLQVELLVRKQREAHGSLWNVPQIESDVSVTAHNYWGVPVSELNQFLGGAITVEGIVHSDSLFRALINYQGKRTWATPGTLVGDGTVTEVHHNGVVVSVGGIPITLPVGGR